MLGARGLSVVLSFSQDERLSTKNMLWVDNLQ